MKRGESDDDNVQDLRRLTRDRQPPGHLRDFETSMHSRANTAALVVSTLPEGDTVNTVQEAQRRSDRPQWEVAIKTELKNHQDNGTWHLEALPGRKAIGAKWVLTIKRRGYGTIDKYKARLVARGFSQIHGIDYEETVSPVVRTGVIRLVLAIAAMNRWPVDQMDVIAAYLNGTLNEEIYMIQPPGFTKVLPHVKQVAAVAQLEVLNKTNSE